MTTRTEFLVAGLDGSPAADEAARWAAAEANRRHVDLRLVHAYWLPATAGYPDYFPYPTDPEPMLREAGQQLLDHTAEDLRLAYPGLNISTRLHHARAESALRQESEHAVLTVVGAGTETRISGVLMGSVALAIASTNPVPVAIIHQGHKPSAGAVVVGVDGSRTSDAAVAFAFEAASVRKTDLIAVHTWNDLVKGAYRPDLVLANLSGIEEEETALLSQLLAGWREKYPDVAVQEVVTKNRAVPALLKHAADAQLLVVGSHGRGGFAGMLLGSTSHALIVHSTCPVVVVRQVSAD